MIALTAISVLSGFFFSVQAQTTTLLPCGTAFYDPSQYNCYNSDFLCPIIGGAATIRCGSDCYLPSQYSCANNRLGPPSTSSTYTLVASAPGTEFDGETVEAAGRNFFLGGSPATYCPTSVGPNCPPGNVTAFAGSSLAVLVPGGQQLYRDPTGNVSFTQAHSIGYPPGSIFGGFNVNGGAASTFAGYPLFACRVVLYTPEVRYQVIALNTSVPESCTKITVLTQDYQGFGAWQYT